MRSLCTSGSPHGPPASLWQAVSQYTIESQSTLTDSKTPQTLLNPLLSSIPSQSSRISNVHTESRGGPLLLHTSHLTPIAPKVRATRLLPVSRIQRRANVAIQSVQGILTTVPFEIPLLHTVPPLRRSSPVMEDRGISCQREQRGRPDSHEPLYSSL